MSIETVEQTSIINEVNVGHKIGHAVHDARRADFALLLAMLSDDVRHNTPVEALPTVEQHHSFFESLAVPAQQQMVSDEDSYYRGQHIASQFNQSGLTAARLQAYLSPEALTYMPEHTGRLPEDVYNNLSEYERQKLTNTSPKSPGYDFQLYNTLVENQRQSELCIQL